MAIKRQRPLPSSVYVVFGGGLGDAFYTYHKGIHGWGYIESLKKRFPQIKVKALCVSHNSNVSQLIKHNPYIAETKNFGAMSKQAQQHKNKFWKAHCGNAERLERQRNLLSLLKFNAPKVFLNKHDKETLQTVCDAGPFVLIHPFAGLRGRFSGAEEEYVPLIDQLIENTDTKVVVIGNNHTRLNAAGKKISIKEEFDYERSGLFNLVNKGNPRLYYHLAKHQEYFIGSWSAYSAASWLHNKLAIVLVPKKSEKKLDSKFKGRWKGKSRKIIKLGRNRDPRPFDEVRKEILDTVKSI